MKALGSIVMMVGLSVAASQAGYAREAASGRIHLVVHSTHGTYTTDVRQEGEEILGISSFGDDGSVNLGISHGNYTGSAGAGFIDLQCENGHCAGLYDGERAEFQFAQTSTPEGRAVMHLEGALNYNRVLATHDDSSIEVKGNRGGMNLKKTAPGMYSGYGVFGAEKVDVRLETSGTLAEVADPALFAIFVVGPFAK
jgi:hypothetical protein